MVFWNEGLTGQSSRQEVNKEDIWVDYHVALRGIDFESHTSLGSSAVQVRPRLERQTRLSVASREYQYG